ncbi:major facilitator superfamily domain-containing protein [Aspergillus falconensis]
MGSDVELASRDADASSQIASPQTDDAEQEHPNSKYALVVTAGFSVMFTTCAFVFSYGVYQSLYEEMAEAEGTPFTGSSTALINLVGILAVALMSMGGPFAMHWSKIYSPQAVIIAGGWVFGIAYILSSFGQALWHFALTQGVLLGIGTCLAYVPTMSVAPTWFDKRRGLAMGVIISGSAVGGMVWLPALRAMITHLGFRNALRISGCISLTLVSVAGYALRWEPKFHEQVRIQTQGLRRRSVWTKAPMFNYRVARSKRFLAQALGCFLQSAGYSTPLFFYAAYASTLGYSSNTAANFITLNNASNFVSRIAIGYGADRYGRINALVVTTLLSAVAVFTFWIPSMFHTPEADMPKSSAEGLFVVFTILYGAFASAYISLFPASLIELFGVQHFTSVNGALYLIRGMGALIGTPLTGMLIPKDALTSSYIYERAGIVVGVLLMAATLACLWVRIEASLGSSWKWRV